MALINDSRGKRALTVAIILALVLAAALLWQFIIVIATAAIASFTFYPVYKLLKRGVKNENLAAWLTAFVTLLAIALPFAVIVAATTHELAGVAGNVSHYVSNNDLGSLASGTIDKIDTVTSKVSGGSVHVSQEQVLELIKKGASYVGQHAPGWLASAAGNTIALLTSVIIYLYVFVAFTTKRKSLVQMIRDINPLGDKISNLYLSRVAAMTKATVRGQFVIAIIQGLLSALLLYIVGIHYFWVAALVLTFLSIIPLGSGIIVLPIGVVLLFTGQVWQGALLIIAHLLLINNVDTVLRPVLVPKEARLNPALMLLAVFAGLSFFGILGIVIGPVLMILIVTTIHVYILETKPNETSVNKNLALADKPKSKK